MKVLLTGANGFVGSHVLEQLHRRQIATCALLRASSSKELIAAHLDHVEVCQGSLNEPASLRAALRGITHVIHCAGATKVARVADYFRTNETGAANLVTAVNESGGAIQRFVHFSSLAAAGPATPSAPAREGEAEHPVSDYGRSKLAGEREVVSSCRAPFVVLRPPAVYGPGDREFLRLFKLVQSGFHPALGSAQQPCSLVFVRDLAEVACACLTSEYVTGSVFYVAAGGAVTPRELAGRISALLGQRTRPLPLPNAAVWTVCTWQEFASRVTGLPNLLNRQKYHELAAPGWVCDASLLRQRAGLSCPTPLDTGLRETLEWYRQRRWLQ